MFISRQSMNIHMFGRVALLGAIVLVLVLASPSALLGVETPFAPASSPTHSSLRTETAMPVAGTGAISVSYLLPAVSYGPNITAFSASPNITVVGHTSYINVTASGGNGTLKYAYTGLPTGCVSANTASLTCTPTAAGNFTVKVYVNDTSANSANATTPLLVRAALSSLSLSPPGLNLTAGSIGNFTAVPTCTGGNCSAQGITYVWSLNNSLGVLNTTTGASVQFTAGASPGNVQIRVNATQAGKNATARANITITALPAPLKVSAFTASPASIFLGNTSYLNVTATGGYPPYTYAYTSLPPGCLTTSVPSLACTPTIAGTYFVGVNVSDSHGNFALGSVTLTVNTPLVISSFLASPATVSLGQMTYVYSTISSGTAPYTYAYSGLPAGCTSANVSSFYCNPTAVGNYTLRLNVTDAAGFRANATTPLLVTGPVISKFVATPSSVSIGQTTDLNVTATGGLLPYSYGYSGLPPGCYSYNMDPLPCVPTAAGTYLVSVTVTDSNFVTATASLNLTVLVPGPLTITSFLASPATILLGQTTNFSVSTTGGYLPLVYNYSGLPASCGYPITASFACTPSTPGHFLVTALITDASGNSTSATTTLTVNSPAGYPSISSFAASPSTVVQGNSTAFTVVTTGGTGTLHFSYQGLPAGCSSVDAATFSCIPLYLGNSTVTVNVTDALGHSVLATTPLTVVASPTAFQLNSVAITPTPQTVAVGTSVTFSANLNCTPTPCPSFGISFRWTLNNPQIGTLSTSSARSTTFTAGATPGTVTLNLAAVHNLTSMGDALTIAVIGSSGGTPSISSFTVSPVSVPVGGTATFSTVVSGGFAPYTYTYSGLPPGCGSANVATLPCVPGIGGLFSVQVIVSDSHGHNASALASLTVTSPSSFPFVTSFAATPSTVAAGTSTTFTVSVTGGSGKLSYLYSGLPTGCTAPDAATFPCTPSAAGNYTVGVTITDSAGHSVAASTHLTVTAARPSTGGSSAWGLGSLLLILAIVAIVVVVVAVVVLLTVRKRKARPLYPASAGISTYQTGPPPAGPTGGAAPPPENPPQGA